MAAKLRLALLKALTAMFVALLFVLVPMPLMQTPRLGLVKDALVVLVLVCYLTKLLYDTLFYDHYRP